MSEFWFKREATMISFIIPGQAVGKGSPRVMRNGGVTYPKKTIAWMDLVKLLARRCAPPEPWLGPIGLDITVTVMRGERPYTHATETDEPISKPDLDNIVKGVADSMSKIIYKDDAQIVNLEITKSFGEQAQTFVTIRRLSQEPTQTGLDLGPQPKRRRRRKKS